MNLNKLPSLSFIHISQWFTITILICLISFTPSLSQATTVAQCEIKLAQLSDQTKQADYSGKHASNKRYGLLPKLDNAKRKLQKTKFIDAIKQIYDYKRKVNSLLAEGKLDLSNLPEPDLLGKADNLIACIEDINNINHAPIADAGPDQTVAPDATVILDGSNSYDQDGELLYFLWSLVTTPTDSTAELDDTSAMMPSFQADKSGEYVAELIVNDGEVDSLANSVKITTENTRPVAHAGADQSKFIADTVILDGSASILM
ncbi:uncharacterized protein BPLS_P5389 [Bathymodiolus platifrons methanotrophic gill symbiont]|uniref:PKD domain-containing protein n=1 Tax=Bathymodiolus platifrons methanotrophic gill symbiont TaxID=113268 RepID=UPI001B59549F|nr:PKD domain-containing protein [Bathymodiolus platifrons methanotrophic gill symbiont]GFO77137.1 uncharacterized protein BPLS_P5389 [Bathymodiolus platifrons methanotrophic gill symbiont]